MYKKIAKHPTILHLYAFQLIAQNKISQEEADDIRARIRTRLKKPNKSPAACKPSLTPRLSGASGRA